MAEYKISLQRWAVQISTSLLSMNYLAIKFYLALLAMLGISVLCHDGGPSGLHPGHIWSLNSAN